ncbi:tyrosine-type recombinase/integrase [Actinomadura litoris]|uniref:tyrosine-type recombinase/integrase n=1 Tax=Actinomadura litoris TaxID=2678616 RepID=UPI0035E45033
MCWTPIAAGLTPHGLRHSHMLEEAGVQQKSIDQRMGHEDGSMRSRYTHVTRKIRDRLRGAERPVA